MNDCADSSVKHILFGGTAFLMVAFMVMALLFLPVFPGGGGGGGGNGGAGIDKGLGSRDAGVGELASENEVSESESEKTNEIVQVKRKKPEPEPVEIAVNINIEPPKSEQKKDTTVKKTEKRLAGSAGSGGESGGGSGGGVGTGRGFGSGTGSGGGQGEAEFMGTEVRGNSFVYVVDKSGSMNGKRMVDAKEELIKSLKKLKNQRSASLGKSRAVCWFYVFFYDSGTTPMPMPDGRPSELMEANFENIEYAINWIEGIISSGGTSPQDSLIVAMDMRPSAVFLMSDGGFFINQDFIEKHLLGKRIPVHTIAFESNAGERVLKQISDATRGIYRFYSAKP